MKRTTLTTTLIAAGVSAALAQGAVAGEDKKGPEYSATSEAHTEYMPFDQVDANADGKLSIEEAGMAMPMVSIEDDNSDGYVNLDEAENAIDGLDFEGHEFDADLDVADVETDEDSVTISGDNEAAESDQDDDDAIVGNAEYQRIVSVLSANEAKTRS